MIAFGDIVVNYIGITMFFIIGHWVSLSFIRGNKEDTEYTKNIKLNKKRKMLLGFFFYKEDKVEMEAVFLRIANLFISIIMGIVAFYVVIQPKIFGIVYSLAWLLVWIGCLIYRFKTNEFKDSKDHY